MAALIHSFSFFTIVVTYLLLSVAITETKRIPPGLLSESRRIKTRGEWTDMLRIPRDFYPFVSVCQRTPEPNAMELVPVAEVMVFFER